MKKGFTLIELLVVVLIIGILSSVALPQYTKAVLKTRVSEALTIGKSLSDAQNVYFMANGSYTEDMDSLDIEVGDLNNFEEVVMDFGSDPSNLSIVFIRKGGTAEDISNIGFSLYNGHLRQIHCSGKKCNGMMPCQNLLGTIGTSAYCNF
ncbi:MAG: prepilin-type N-terminal cleavage/methylation domain-containing protein [Elusimicrobiaceae bacterium]|nr:prepilin-type N-terminal cleavage/methylation domain-containing protein [Elusimicrobiaceae bacterium]